VRLKASLAAAAVAIGFVTALTGSAVGATTSAPKNGDLVFLEGFGGITTQAPGEGSYHGVTEGDEPKYSPNGKQLAFLRSGDVWVRTLSTGAERQVTHTGGTVGAYLAWSGDAKSIVTSDGNRLEKVTVSTGAVTTLYTASTAVQQPAWSPDGTLIAFSTGTAIKTITSSGTGLRTVSSGGSNTFPDWRPDSKALAFITTRFTGKSEMVTVPRTATAATTPFRVSWKAYPQGLHHIGVAWSPDGKKIAVLQFNANHEPNDQDTDERFKVRAYLPDGTHSYSLTGPIVGDDGPEGLDWAPKLTS
jgi:Tol biopolymer transport system component